MVTEADIPFTMMDGKRKTHSIPFTNVSELSSEDSENAYLPRGIMIRRNRDEGPFLTRSDRFAVTQIHPNLNDVGWRTQHRSFIRILNEH